MKKILQRLFIPKPSTAILISIPLYVFVGAVLAKEITGPVAYLAYFLSSYALVITCIAIAKLIPSWKKTFLHSRFYLWLTSLPIIGTWITNDAIRIRTALYIGTFINLLYVILKITTGAIYHSAWLILFGLYYLFLAVLRLFIIRADRIYTESNDLRGEYKTYRFCGIQLLVLNIFLCFITVMASRLEGTIDYPGLLIFGMAFYSFYATIATAVNAVRYRGHTHPMFTAARISSFTAALVSMLSLEIAMTARFGAEDISFRKQMTALTGLGVCSIVLIVAVSMIIKSSTWFKQSRN